MARPRPLTVLILEVYCLHQIRIVASLLYSAPSLPLLLTPLLVESCPQPLWFSLTERLIYTRLPVTIRLGPVLTEFLAPSDDNESDLREVIPQQVITLLRYLTDCKLMIV